MNNMDNRIFAEALALAHVFENKHYVIDVYQREYKWQRKQVADLLDDLYFSFINSINRSEEGFDIDTSDTYFMGTIVVSQSKKEMSIVDGQQRLTTFTLLFIYLHNLCKKLNIEDEEITRYIIYRKRTENNTFVLDIPERLHLIKQLLEDKNNWKDVEEIGNDESISNMINAYQQICEDFPADLCNQEKLPLFVEWLFFHVVLICISTNSSEKAYTIFETMNDRGLTLTPTEILKAYIISQIEDDEKKFEVNKLWHNKINLIIQQAGDNSDADFFKAWFRAKYAETIRSSSSNTKKEDFESIGAHYHTWFKNNKGFNLRTSQDYYYFLKGDFDFFSNLFIKVKQHQWMDMQDKLRGIYITSCYPLADSLYLPLLMSPLLTQDTEDEIERKIQMVNDFVDDFNNLKTLAYQSIAQTSVRNYLNNLILSIRNCTICDLRAQVLNEKNTLLQSERISLDTFAPGAYYIHYFLARLRFNGDTNVDFCSLLRTKRQTSLIAVPIVNYDEVEQFNIDNNTSLKYNVLINYCLIKRNQQNAYYQFPFLERLKWLRDEGYLNEMDNEPIEMMNVESFMVCRKMKFEEFIDKTWVSISKYE